jgi:hypothetical protein
MTTISDDEFRFLVSRAGLSMPDDELLELKSLYDALQERLQPLRNADLSEEEVSGIFLPGASGVQGPAGEVRP